MISNLTTFLTKSDLQSGREIDYRKLAPYFILTYLSFTNNNQDVARQFNWFIHKIKEKYIQDALYLNVVKSSNRFHWNGSYIRKNKEIEIPDLKAKAKKYFNWSEKEWKENSPLILNERFFYCDFFNVENADRKVLGLKPIKVDKINKPTVKPKIESNLEAWL